MRLSLVVNVVGAILRVFGLLTLAPGLVALYYDGRSDVGGFATTGVVAVGLGWAMHVISRRGAGQDLRPSRGAGSGGDRLIIDRQGGPHCFFIDGLKFCGIRCKGSNVNQSGAAMPSQIDTPMKAANGAGLRRWIGLRKQRGPFDHLLHSLICHPP